ncbi:hypothetical protein O0L34_g15816 [Tuta absoluta]|nr:hypothetical protein O0L34_g15816 [Tuta absoluta]
MKTSRSDLSAAWCTVCVCRKRHLYRLSKYLQIQQIFLILCRDNGLEVNHNTFICWECMTQLKKVKQFRETAKKSQVILSRINSELTNANVVIVVADDDSNDDDDDDDDEDA